MTASRSQTLVFAPMEKPALRALKVVRLSKVTDATTSPERQRKDNQELCDQRGYEVVGEAEDLDVSAGKTSPFDRPQLGDWLNNRFHEFDVLVVWRMDRIVRSLLDLADLIRWCQKHSVALVSASEPFLDLTAPFGDIIALLVAKVAEMELAAISERNASAARHLIRSGRYRGSAPPWGYLADNSTGQWRLVQDPEQVKIIGEIVERVIAGESLWSIAHDLIARGVPTPRDRMAQFKGKKPKGHLWQSSVIKRALMSPTLLGYSVMREPLTDAQGRVQKDSAGRKKYGPEEIVRNEDGSPLVRATPILSREVFDRVVEELTTRRTRKAPTKKLSSLLVSVILCGVCGRPMYKSHGNNGRTLRYRCSAARFGPPCGNGTVKLDEADCFLTENLLDLFGDSDRLERVWDAGSDHSAELAELDATLADLTGLVGTGPYRAGTAQRETLDRRIEALAERQATLAAEAVRPSGWAWKPTGEKFADWWDRQDVKAQNMWLRSMGIKMTFKNLGGAPEWAVDFGDLEGFQERLQFGKSAQEVVRRITKQGD